VSNSLVFGVDLDGVCADYTLGLRKIAAEVLGVAESSLPMERSWDFREWGLSAQGFEELHRVAVVDHRLLRELPAMDGAADVLWRLSDAGVWIRIITHRLYVNWGHAIAVSDTVTWLDEARIPYRDICFLGVKPEVEADLYIEDAEHNIQALRAGGNEVIVFDQPYNRDLQAPRAATWYEVEELVYEIAARRGFMLDRQLPGFDAGGERLRRRQHPA
jgi:5'(3')-deoxyribonucleotidase